MINTEKYNKILDAGLLLDHFFLLLLIRDNKPIHKNKRVTGFHNLLCKKGYVEDNALTDKGKELVGEELLVGASKSLTVIEVDKVEDDKFDYGEWIVSLHNKCKSKLIELTGKGQVMAIISGKRYPFLCNSTDLGRTILRAVQAYKLADFKKIERTIISYIEECAHGNNWFPIIQYFIMKNGVSTMVTKMETVDEPIKNDDSIVNI